MPIGGFFELKTHLFFFPCNNPSLLWIKEEMRDKKEQFEALHRDYAPMVQQMCLGFMKGDRELAQDLGQETFINIWKALASFKGASSPKTWIYRITVNTCLKYIRDHPSSASIPVENIQDKAQEAKNSEQFSELYEAIGRLGKVDRLITMMLLEDLDYEHIAEIMGISPGNLRVKIHRIKKKLKVLLAHG